MNKSKGRVSPALVISIIALVLAAGGTSFASLPVAFLAKTLGLNSKQKKQVKSIADSEIKSKAPKLSVLYAKTAGSATAAGTATSATNATNATNANYATTAGSAPWPSTLPSGKTLYGAYSILGKESGGANDRSSADISFPIPLAAAPKESVVVPFGGPNPDAASCPGSAAAPAAAPGKLCVYEGAQTNTAGTKICPVTSEGVCGPGTGGVADRFGASINTFASAAGTYYTAGTWAVTAP